METAPATKAKARAEDKARRKAERSEAKAENRARKDAARLDESVRKDAKQQARAERKAALRGGAAGGPTRMPVKNQPRHWHRLDNNANIFPVITGKKGSNVYRISINLRQPVAPELLQRALEEALPWFAAFQVKLRRGMFWFYLEHNPGAPKVHEEDDYPCKPINPHQNEDFLFHISYFESRINLEAFHALSDGAGAVQFLQALCCRYLMLAHPAAFSEEDKARRWFAENAANTEDGYVQSYTPTKKANYNLPRAWRLRGERNLLDNLSVVHAHLRLEEILAFCRGRGMSVTHYFTACIAWALYTQQLNQKPARHPVSIFVPVDLRSYFDSSTTLNFFSNIYITLGYEKPGLSFEDILAEVKRQFEEKLNREAMQQKISYTVGSGYSLAVRMVPLPLKNLALRIIYGRAAKASTMGFSNVGSLAWPPAFEPYVAGASVLLSTSRREVFKVAAFGTAGVLSLSFTSTLRSMALQREIVRRLSADGLNVTIESNGVDYASL